MKKILLVIAMLAVLMMTGCNKEVKTEVNTEQNNNSQQPEVVTNNDENKSFEERTKEFAELKAKLENDELHRQFANVRLSKIDNHYEIVADLVGNVFISKEDLDNAVKKIENEKLEKLDVEVSNGMTITIYSKRPDETKTRLENVENDTGFDYEVNQLGYINVPTYDDMDWFNAKSDSEWLDEEGLPMYIDASSLGDYEHWAKLYKDDKDNYFLYGREAAGRTEPYKLTAVTDKNILTISLNQDDIVVLDIFDFYGDVHSDDEYIPEEITVKDYYEKSPTTITKNLIDNWEITLYIDNANMSKSNNHNVGLDIKDGKIFVFADYVGP